MIIQSIKRPWQKHNQGTRYNPDPFYHTREWKSIRKAKLRQDPYCECPDCKGKKIPATMVDHITPIKQGGSRTEMSNLQSMTDSCHAKKSAREKNEKYRKRPHSKKY